MFRFKLPDWLIKLFTSDLPVIPLDYDDLPESHWPDWYKKERLAEKEKEDARRTPE